MSLRIGDYITNRTLVRTIKYFRGALEIELPGGIAVVLPKTTIKDIIDQYERDGIALNHRIETQTDRWGYSYTAMILTPPLWLTLKNFKENQYVGDILAEVQASGTQP